MKRDRDRQEEKEKIIVRKAYNTTDSQTDKQTDRQTERQTYRHMILLTAMALVSVAG